MSMANYLENALLNHVLKGIPYSAPSTKYLALFTDNPGETGAGTEVSGSAYARQIITFSDPSAGTITSALDVLFPVSTGSWGTITHVGIMDSLSGGNMLFYGQLGTVQTVSVNNQLVFKAGQITLTLD